MSKSVLVIEDDQWLAELEKDVLNKSGYMATVAANAYDAIDAVDAHKPSVIVADVLLAGSTIFAFLNELQSYEDTARIPVVLCTNTADQLSPELLKKYNVRRVIDKTTMHPDDIVAAVVAVSDDGGAA